MTELTASDRRRYSDYSVEILELNRTTHVSRGDDNELMRFMVQVHRIPSLKVFRCRIYQGLSGDQRAAAERRCLDLPGSEWIRFASLARRRRGREGTIFFQLYLGEHVDVDWTELELQMMLELNVGDRA